MSQRHAFVTDVPDLSKFVFPDGGPEDAPAELKPPTSRIQVAKVGKFKHPLYGKFAVTRDTFDSFVANLTAKIVGDQLPGDFDHEPDKGGKSGACGWLKALHPDGDDLFATVDWNWEGAWAIREGIYRWISPTWQLSYTDEEGVNHGPTLFAFALTNRPFFTRMASVSLSQSFSATFAGPAVEDIEPQPAPASPELFERTFNAALRAERVTAEQKALLQQIFSQDSDAALTILNERMRVG